MNQRLVQIALVVKDYDEAIAFYTQKLNFSLIEDTVLSETKRWVVIKPNGEAGCNILLAKAANEEQTSRIGNQTGGRVFLFMHTDDIKRDYNNLTSNGIEFIREPSKEVYGTVAVFKDLYGNLWDLIEPIIQLNFSAFPILETERLLLRALQSSDVREVFALRSDDNINKYIERPKAKTIDDAYAFIERIKTSVANKASLLWAIELKQTNAFAGSVLLWNINKEKNEIETGYELLPQYHGKGIMQEAIRAVMAYAFNSLKFDSVVAVAHKDNVPSLKLLQRNSFQFKADIEDKMKEYILTLSDFKQ